jgi:HEPN superfamily RiboL-PSP-like protein
VPFAKASQPLLPLSFTKLKNTFWSIINMSEAAKAFDRSITDAQELLDRFDDEKMHSNGRSSETLKRAGMVIAMAAWETYVKDRIQEEFEVYLKAVEGSLLGRFVTKRLNEDLKRFYNPNSDKTKRIFLDYFEIDVTQGWVWDNYDTPQAKKALNVLISKRGDAAHKANTSSNPNCDPHLVKRDELEKAIRFLKGLVAVTDKIKMVK